MSCGLIRLQTDPTYTRALWYQMAVPCSQCKIFWTFEVLATSANSEYVGKAMIGMMILGNLNGIFDAPLNYGLCYNGF
jgi:hypothetical protein